MDVRTVEVEEWLHSLPYAPATKSKIRNIMSALFMNGCTVNRSVRRFEKRG